MKITIATVCYNAQQTIENTIKSVINQTYSDIEYLIIDGKSTDKTLDIIDKYAGDSRIRLVSEEDTGLYNAMNKAIKICTGDYIIYMNSGDVFHDYRVIEEMMPYMDADIVYGNVVRIKSDGRHLEKYHGKYTVMRLLLTGMMMCHQAMFTRIDIMRKYGFDENYSITADYDFVVRAKKDKCKMKYIDRNVAIVDNIEGISSQVRNNDIMRMEDDRSLKANFPVWYYIIKIPKGIVRLIKRRNE
jgi:glycosyltransferase involved in cell wall biosynthesis